MKKFSIYICLLLISTCNLLGQEKDSLIFKGQLSTWGNYNFTTEQAMLGGRYIPELSFSKDFRNAHSLAAELSANTYGTWHSHNGMDGKIKPYRAWVRYSTPQLELRAGLQKINFGSATMLRPLMWFDSMDPRDPLQLTDGVWGLLGRYYFLNNANVWMWGLYGNKEPRGWEAMGSHKSAPELGGRVQLPIGIGEMAFTFHRRAVSTEKLAGILGLPFDKYMENRYGFDTKIDWLLGFWVEGAWVNSRKELGLLTNQTILNIGTDYTFGIGNGLLAVYEQLVASTDQNPFAFSKPITLSLLSVSYPLTLFDNVGAILYYSWNNSQVYSFLSWQRTYNKFAFHVMAYWNPDTFDLPQQNLGGNMFGGKGIQVMLVFNH